MPSVPAVFYWLIFLYSFPLRCTGSRPLLALSPRRKLVCGGGVSEWFRSVEKWQIRWHFSLPLGSVSRKRKKHWKMKRWVLPWRTQLFRYDPTYDMGKIKFVKGQLWNQKCDWFHFIFETHMYPPLFLLYLKWALTMGSEVTLPTFGY